MKPINDKIIKWSPPDLPIVKVNFMALFKYPQLLWVLLSEIPMVPLSAAFIHIGLSHVSVAKALALRDALSQALAGGFSHILAESDSKLLIDSLNHRIEVSCCREIFQCDRHAMWHM